MLRHDELLGPPGGEKESTMQEPQGPTTGTTLEDRLRAGVLAGTWALDPTASTVRFQSRSVWGLVAVKGVFHEVSGTGTVSSEGEVSGTVTVAAASVDTKNAKRDTHLRSADFFDTEHTPDIAVTVEGVHPSDRGATVTGTLTVRDRTRPLSLDAEVSERGDGEVVVDAEARVDRSDFGLTWNQLGMASMQATVSVHAVFTRQ